MEAEQTAVEAVLKQPDIGRTKFTLKELVQMQNIAEHIDEHKRELIGTWVIDGYMRDKQSRRDWEQRMDQAMKLALQVKEDKSFPWTGCSNVKMPLITIGALQFLARVSILTKGRNLVKLEVIGGDLDGEKSKMAKRLSGHMSFQLIDEDKTFHENDEQTKLAAAICGHAIKKKTWDPIKGTQRSEFVPAQNFVTDYYCKDLESANRMTHVLSMSANKVETRVKQGMFLKMKDPVAPQGGSQITTNLMQIGADEAQGVRPLVEGEEYAILEQYNWFDFDGDGYAEPYIMSVRQDTGQLLRIVARYFDVGDVHRLFDPAVAKYDALAQAPETTPEDRSRYEKKAQALLDDPKNEVLCIDAFPTFNKTIFIPSPDGGGLGLGFGLLLGPLNDSVDTILNQLVDAGTMSNTKGGFLGRGVKLKGGKTSFDPFEWKPVDSTGDDLRKNIFPLPTSEPSPTLFQLLEVLITYAEKLTGSTDIMTGVSPGQNTPATTSQNTIEQGMMLFSGIYNRMYRAFRNEIEIQYKLNRIYLKQSPKYRQLTQGPNALIMDGDYDLELFRVFPAASAEAVTKSQMLQKAEMLLQWAYSPMGMGSNKYEVTKRWLETNEVDDIDTIWPDPKGPKAIPVPPNPEIELEKQKLQQEQAQHQDNMQLEVVKLKQQQMLNESKAQQLLADAEKKHAEATGVQDGHAIAAAELEVARIHAQNAAIDTAVKAIEAKAKMTMDHVQHLDKMSLEHKKLQQDKVNANANNGSTKA